MKILLRRKVVIFALSLLFCLVLISILAPVISPFDPQELDPMNRLQSPNSSHWFGTDSFGQDVLSRVLWGARLSLLTGTAITSIALICGIPLGVISGYYTKLGLILMRVVDGLMAFPSIMLALAFMAILGKPGLINVIIAVGTVYTPRMARIIYGSTLQLRESGYVEAARALGAGDLRILLRHIVINLLSPVIVQATFTFAFSMLEVAVLDFLGVGVPPHIPSWGTMINEGQVFIQRAPWVIIFPGIFLALTVLSLNLVGDALRDQLDPKLRHAL